MVDLELIQKILLVDGLVSFDLNGLELAKRFLTGEEDIELLRSVFSSFELDDLVDKRSLVDFINYYGLENLYVGDRINYYTNEQLKLRSMPGEDLLPEMDLGGKRSLFRHEKTNYYYYDLLDKNCRCEHIHPDIIYLRDGCGNMKSLSSMLYKEYEKKKLRRG